MNEAGARNIDFRKIIGGFKQRNVESAGEAASKGALVAARIAGGDCEGMKFSVMPHAKRDDRRIEATGNPYEDRGELRGPRRDAIEDNLPKGRSEEHTSELQSLMRTTYAVFCLKKKTPRTTPIAEPKVHTTHKQTNI